MPTRAKKPKILDKVRQTFAILREMLSDTPLRPVEPPVLPFSPSSDLRPYLDRMIQQVEMLTLPWNGTDGRAMQVGLEDFFFPISVFDIRIGKISPDSDDGFYGGADQLSLTSAMRRYQNLVITGHPGSGKSTLLAYLMLVFARGLRSRIVRAGAEEKPPATGRTRILNRGNPWFGLDDCFPVLLNMTDLVSFMGAQQHSSLEKDVQHLAVFLQERFEAQSIILSPDFFKTQIDSGRFIFLCDGLEQVVDPIGRQRAMQFLAYLAQVYPEARIIITTRQDAGELLDVRASAFGVVRICELDRLGAKRFVRLLSMAIGRTSHTRAWADDLLDLLGRHPALLRHGLTPELLTLSVMAFQKRGSIPERRAGLLTLILAISLGQRGRNHGAWSDIALKQRQAILETVAFWLLDHDRFAIGYADLHRLVYPAMLGLCEDDPARANELLIEMLLYLEQRDIFCESSPGVYTFTRPVFLEYLAGCAVSLLGNDEITSRASHRRWREALVLTCGILRARGNAPALEMLQSLLYHDVSKLGTMTDRVLLAGECLASIGQTGLSGTVIQDLKKQLKETVGLAAGQDQKATLMSLAAEDVLSHLGGHAAHPGGLWKKPFGEPNWIIVPAGEFWMGEAGELHRVHLPEYRIARFPVTNAQYALYVRSSGVTPPDHWCGDEVPAGLELHPVVHVTWHAALGYCAWLGQKIGQPVGLPSEAEWEKAARGDLDQRLYPWGEWAEQHANTSELGLGATTPVNLFTLGASPYGVLDMVGNVREWTRSLYKRSYPYNPQDTSREDTSAADSEPRVLRGGSFYYHHAAASCCHRQQYYPDFKFANFGFRVVVSPLLGLAWGL